MRHTKHTRVNQLDGRVARNPKILLSTRVYSVKPHSMRIQSFYERTYDPQALLLKYQSMIKHNQGRRIGDRLVTANPGPFSVFSDQAPFLEAFGHCDRHQYNREGLSNILGLPIHSRSSIAKIGVDTAEKKINTVSLRFRERTNQTEIC
jgi:hypothetical protein